MSESHSKSKGKSTSKHLRRLISIIATIIIAAAAAGIYVFLHRGNSDSSEKLICPLPSGLKLDDAYFSEPLLSADGSKCAVIAKQGATYFLLSDDGSISICDPIVAEEIRKTEEEFRKAATQAADTQASSQPGKYNITYDFPKSWSPQSFEPKFGASITANLSPNGKHIVVVTTKVGEKKTLLLDGKEVVKCDDIQSWWFNPQGQLEYIAKDNGKCMLVTARGKSEEYESIKPLDENIPGYPGCSKFLCTKSYTEKYLILDWKRYGPYVNILYPIVDDEGKHFACFVGDDDPGWRINVDGEIGDRYDGIGTIIISKSGGHVVFSANGSDDKWFVVADGKEEKCYDRIEDIATNNDGSYIVYTAKSGDTYAVVADGKTYGPYAHVGKIMLGPDEKRLAVAAHISEQQEAIWLDGELGQTYRDVGCPIFSLDGKRFAYSATRSDGGQCVVLDGTQGTGYGIVSDLVFSPDGKHFAYRVADTGMECVVVDGVQKKAYDGVRNLLFSPNSKRLAYIAKNAKTDDYYEHEIVVCDDNEKPPCQFIDSLSFDKDSTLLYLVGKTVPAPKDAQVGEENKEFKKYTIAAEDWRAKWEDRWAELDIQLDLPKSISTIQEPLELNGGSGLFGSSEPQPILATTPPKKYCFGNINGQKHVIYATGHENTDREIYCCGVFSGPEVWNNYDWLMNDYRIVIDGVSGTGYAIAGNFTLSPDGKRYAYSAQRTLAGPDFNPSKGRERDYCFEDKNFVNIDGRELPVAGPASKFAFSADGTHIAYRVEDWQSHTQRIVLDEIPQPAYRWVSRPVFRADGVIIYYAINDAGLHRIAKRF